jgi:hypothetical protein
MRRPRAAKRIQKFAVASGQEAGYISKAYGRGKGLSIIVSVTSIGSLQMFDTIKYNRSWWTETPPGTSLQAIWLMGDQAYSFFREIYHTTFTPFSVRCTQPRGSDMYLNTLWVGAARDHP